MHHKRAYVAIGADRVQVIAPSGRACLGAGRAREYSTCEGNNESAHNGVIVGLDTGDADAAEREVSSEWQLVSASKICGIWDRRRCSYSSGFDGRFL